MPVETELLSFIKGIFLFSGLSSDQLIKLGESASSITLSRGEFLFRQGQKAGDLYLLWNGKILLSTGKGKSMRRTGILMFGDFLGEETLSSPVRLNNAMALSSIKVVKIPRQAIINLCQEVPAIRNQIIITSKSRRFIAKKKINWINEDEIVYMLTRKHPFFLIVRLIVPSILILALLGIFIPGLLSGNPTHLTTGIIILILITFWFFWVIFDWENDYYVVTNQRVIWIEKVIMLYDSRQEAPLHTILSTKKTLHPVLGAFIDYATVVVNTYTGSIVLKRINHPDIIISYIDGLKQRAQLITKQLADQEMENAIRQRLGSLKSNEVAPLSNLTLITKTLPKKKKSGWSEIANFFKMRYEEEGRIVYRKHWFIFIQKTWLPGFLGSAILLGAGVIWSNSTFEYFICIPWFLLQSIIGLWWIYNVVDWHNDIYMLTQDSILDIEKKPLRSEEKRVAQLDNILSLQNSRKGFISLLLNYGTVEINVGTEKFTFDMVNNPLQVQYEISDRMMTRKRKKEEEQAAHERERVANWFAIYYKHTMGTPGDDEPHFDNLLG